MIKVVSLTPLTKQTKGQSLLLWAISGRLDWVSKPSRADE